MATHGTSSNTILSAAGIVLILSGLAASYLYLLPQLHKANLDYQSMVAQEAAAKKEVAALQAAQDNLTQVEANLKQRNLDQQTVAQVYPATEELPSLYIQMENQIKNAQGVTGLTYQIGKPATSPDGVKIPINLAASGSYADLKKFITQLENNIRPLSFSSLSFVLDTTKGGSVLALTATGYFRAAQLSLPYANLTVPTTAGSSITQPLK